MKEGSYFRPRLEPLEDRQVPSTFTVNTLLDENTPNDGLLSLREAILAANLSMGTNTIAFNIAGSGVHSLVLLSALPPVTNPVIIDGTTEGTSNPGGSIEINGMSAGTNANGLDVQGGNSMILALAINHFSGNGIKLDTNNSDTVQGCFIGTDFGGTTGMGNGQNGILVNNTTGNTIGGTALGAGNVISGNGGDGVLLQGGGATANVLQGNRIGVNAAGTAIIANAGDGVLVSAGQDNIIGNSRTPGDTSSGARNIISGNGKDGVHIQNLSATNNVVTGNYIGVTAVGTGTLGNLAAGVELDGAVGTFMGFKVVNVIGGNAIGVVLDNGAQDNAVVNNYIGVGADGMTAVGNAGQGVALHSSGTAGELPVQVNSIGGTAPGAGNIIAFNGQAGVAVFSMPLAGNGQQNDGNQILGNSIYSNSLSSPATEVGIDLVATTTFPTDDGPTPNTPGGPHTGPNDLQNTPVLSGAANNRNNAGTVVAGTLNSTPNSTFRIEIFDNTTANQTGFGEGKTFLTFLNVTTDAAGNATFSAILTPTVPLGHFLTATATDPNRNTSEFCKAVQVGAAGADIVGRVNETGEWWVAQSTGSSFANRLWETWNPNVTWDDVVTGDFNGDGVTDFAGRVDETGEWWVALSNGSGFTTTRWTTWNSNVFWTNVVVGDFTGSGMSDIAGREADNGNWWVAVSNGNSFTNQFWTNWNPNVTWVDVSVGRFTNKTMDDIVGRAAEIGQWWVAHSTGSGVTNSLWATWSTAITWADVQVGDFNGDGLSDITGRVDETGEWWTGVSNGIRFDTSLWGTWSTAVTWVDVQVGDFDGHGKAEIVGRADEIGQWWVGVSSGSGFSNKLWGTWSTAVGWNDVQVGDFNNDGISDIAGRVDGFGQWWVAVSNGTQFTNQLWTTWSIGITWVDVNSGKF
jgi:CSLREA domain-containing protein